MRFSRRLFVAGALAAPFVTGRAAFATEDNQGTVRNNISAFRTHEWQDHFDALGVGVIISDTTAKVLQHWTSDGQMYLYPSSVPLSDELTRRGYTEVVEKRVNPSWAPTPSMRERNPEWPAFVPGGDPTPERPDRIQVAEWQVHNVLTGKVYRQTGYGVTTFLTAAGGEQTTISGRGYRSTGFYDLVTTSPIVTNADGDVLSGVLTSSGADGQALVMTLVPGADFQATMTVDGKPVTTAPACQ